MLLQIRIMFIVTEEMLYIIGPEIDGIIVLDFDYNIKDSEKNFTKFINHCVVYELRLVVNG